jgi:hypothetical protein
MMMMMMMKGILKFHKLPREQITAELKNGRRIKSSPTISALFLVNEV